MNKLQRNVLLSIFVEKCLGADTQLAAGNCGQNVSQDPFPREEGRPRRDARCPMADMVTVERLRELKRKHPDAKVVSYVNTNADLKAESYICCTSSNA